MSRGVPPPSIVAATAAGVPNIFQILEVLRIFKILKILNEDLQDKETVLQHQRSLVLQHQRSPVLQHQRSSFKIFKILQIFKASKIWKILGTSAAVAATAEGYPPVAAAATEGGHPPAAAAPGLQWLGGSSRIVHLPACLGLRTCRCWVGFSARMGHDIFGSCLWQVMLLHVGVFSPMDLRENPAII